MKIRLKFILIRPRQSIKILARPNKKFKIEVKSILIRSQQKYKIKVNIRNSQIKIRNLK